MGRECNIMNRGKFKDLLYVLPLAFILGVTPLIVHYKKIKLGKVVASYWIGDFNTDFFSYYKMWAFLIFILLALVSFYIYIKKEKKIKKTIYYIPIAVYMLMILISTIFSECKLTSLYGFPDRYEGMPVLLAYMFIVIIVINLVNTKKQVKFLLTILLISAAIIGIIGIYQFFGMDFLQSYIAQKLMLPIDGYKEISSNLNFRFDKKNIISATLYNPNNVGSYFAMLFPLTFVMYLFAGSRKYKALYGALNLLMFANWLGSMSRAGIIGGLFALLILAFLLRAEIKKRWQSILVIFICFGLVFMFMDLYTGGKLRREFISLGEETKIAMQGKTAKIQDIKNEDGFLIFATTENKLKVSFNDYGVMNFYDGQDNKLDFYLKRYEDGKDFSIHIEDEGYEEFQFRLLDNDESDAKLIELIYGRKKVNFIADSKLNIFS